MQILSKKYKYCNLYKYITVFIILAILFGLFPQLYQINKINKVNAADITNPTDTTDTATDTSAPLEDKTQIKSVIPYVEKKENEVTQNVPIESKDDITNYPTTVSLTVQVYVSAADASKYYGQSLYIFKLKPYEEITDVAGKDPAAHFDVNSSDSFTYNVSLYVDLSNLNNGEIYNKFVAAAKDGDSYVPLSDAQYISNINCLSNKRETPPVSKTKKGLSTIQMLGEASLLGVGYTTVKMTVNDFMSPGPTANTETYVFNGENFYFNIDKISDYDKKIKYFTNEGINVTAVIIISADGYLQSLQANQPNQPNGSSGNDANPDSNSDAGAPVNPVEALIHPNALASLQNNNNSIKPYYCGVNSTNEDGFKYFAALMSFIADRYVKPEDSGYGRIYNIILGDQIDRSTMYNYCGQIDIVQYVKDYLRALRICDTAIRSRFGGSRVYVPFDNWFASKPDGDNDYISKEIIDLLCDYSQKEGNFIWDVAFHAYNANISSPQCWLETSPTNGYETPIITMKNIQVLCDYLNLEKKDYLPNGETRKVMLSDQGFSSVDNSKENMDLQAAAFVYAYLKAKYIPDITAFIYHGQVDSTNESGKFGLWTNEPDTVNDPGVKKKIYDVFKYMDTNREAEQIAFAKPILGIKDFTEIVPLYSENTEPAVVLKEVAGKSLKPNSMTNSNIGRFSKTDLSGFIGSANISDLSLTTQYSNPDSKWNGYNMLFAGFIAPKKGDFGGILKIYADTDPIENLKGEKYVGVNLRIDTDISLPPDQKIQLILTLEGDAGDSGAFGTSASETSTGTIVSALSSASPAKTLDIYEGMININPNEDTTVYFDISQWDGRVNIKKIKLLVNPYSNSSVQNIYSTSNADAAAQDSTDPSGSGIADISSLNSSDSTGKNYDFKLYVYSIVSSHNSKASFIQAFLTGIVVIVCLLAAAYAALYIRARVLRERHRRERELLRKRRARAAAQGRLTQGAVRAQLPPGTKVQMPPGNADNINNQSGGVRGENAKNMSDIGNIGYAGQPRSVQNSHTSHKHPTQTHHPNANTNIPQKKPGSASNNVNNSNNPNRNNNPFR
ncbi:MAG: DUF5722 domain-containing protein [Oscillospiraceae bacterium]|nr:DUF5722 domain-containing protein [Oscillospiraceae bacterium]